jgi:hypothetical protein
MNDVTAGTETLSAVTNIDEFENFISARQKMSSRLIDLIWVVLLPSGDARRLSRSTFTPHQMVFQLQLHAIPNRSPLKISSSIH